MDTARIIYLGDLRTEASHVRSGQHFVTDAPVDNKGKGEAFSPTDLLSVALATCMMTTMGITAQGHGIPIKRMEARVVKQMASDPRRVDGVVVDLEVALEGTNEKWRALLERSGRTCPVALSLAPSVRQEMTFRFV